MHNIKALQDGFALKIRKKWLLVLELDASATTRECVYRHNNSIHSLFDKFITLSMSKYFCLTLAILENLC